jgi:hypothetical protein
MYYLYTIRLVCILTKQKAGWWQKADPRSSRSEGGDRCKDPWHETYERSSDAKKKKPNGCFDIKAELSWFGNFKNKAEVTGDTLPRMQSMS